MAMHKSVCGCVMTLASNLSGSLSAAFDPSALADAETPSVGVQRLDQRSAAALNTAHGSICGRRSDPVPCSGFQRTPDSESPDDSTTRVSGANNAHCAVSGLGDFQILSDVDFR
jgi:hypothetical protein